MPWPKGVTASRQKIVLKALAEVPNISRAARVAGVSHTAVKNWRQKDPKFAEKCAEAIAQGVAELEAAAWARAKDGVEEYVVSQGKVVIWDGKPLTKKVFADSLVPRLLAAHDERYRNTHTVDMTIRKPPQELSDDELAAIASGSGASAAGKKEGTE